MKSELARARMLYILGLVYLLVGYLGTNEFAAQNPFGRPALPIATELDHALPFVPWTVIFYVMYYPLLLTPLFFSRSAAALYRMSLGQAVMNTIAYVVFLLFPTPIDRPYAVPVEGVFHSVLDLLFRADHPYNTFPSLHVGQTCILALFFLRYSADWVFGKPETSLAKNRLSVIVILFHAVSSLLVAASAVLIKQHYLADIFAGALLAWSMSMLFFHRRNNS
jgi:hypothetical protein